MEREQIKSKVVDMLIGNINIVREHLDDVGDDWEFAEHKARLDELIYVLCKKQEAWDKRK